MMCKEINADTIFSNTGNKYSLGEKIGKCGQGIIYSTENNEFITKLYYPTGKSEIDENIIEKIKYIKDTNAPKNFAPIIDVIEQPYIGYVMEKENGYKTLNSYLVPDKGCSVHEWYNKGLGLYERLFVGYIIAKAFENMEKQYLYFCDISTDNIFVKIDKNSAIKITDIDDIYTPGKGISTNPDSTRYTAPEIAKGLRCPDVLSDNYSLAVLLYELLRVGHPYSSDKNSINMLPAEIVFTEEISRLFERCFVDGCANRAHRPSASEFQNAFLKATNKIVKCPNCGAWHYLIKKEKEWRNCPWCDFETKPKAIIYFYDMLFAGEDYKTIDPNECLSSKLEDLFVIKENRRNRIKGFYFFKNSESIKLPSIRENYLTIVHNEKGYYVYNEFSKEGIVIKRFRTGQFNKLDYKKALLLQNGDEIYFEVNDSDATKIECAGHTYSYVKMAKFMEV